MQREYKAKTKIFRKLLTIVSASVIICVLCTSGFIYFYLRPMIENSLIDKKKNMVAKMCGQEVNVLEGIKVYARNITFDDTVQNFLREGRKEEGYDYYSGILAVEKRLKDYRMIYGGLIQDIFIVDRNGKVLETLNTYQELPKEEVFSQLGKGNAVSGFTEPFVFDYYGMIGKKNLLAYVNTIYDKNGILVEMGRLVILLDADRIDESLTFDEDVRLQLLTPEGVLLFDNLGNENAVYMDILGDEGWQVKYQIDNREITESIGRINSMVAGVLAAVLIGMLLILVTLVMRVVKPFDTLIGGMQRVAGGSRKEHIEIHTNDECEEAANVFNSMVESIRLHTQELVESEKKQYETQLKLLSYQLNPHFIYNTLNAIICLARKQDCENIILLTRAFIMLLQSLLRTDLSAMTTVEKEQEYIDNYVRVLQMCYRNVPDIIWEIQDGFAGIELPRMILYPLVENSVFHGIVPSDRTCMLRVSITGENGWISVLVEDNGVGCSDEELDRIRKRLAGECIGDHIGLFNVNGRLKLIYGERCSFSIDSRAGGGTCIGFRFYSKEV